KVLVLGKWNGRISRGNGRHEVGLLERLKIASHGKPGLEVTVLYGIAGMHERGTGRGVLVPCRFHSPVVSLLLLSASWNNRWWSYSYQDMHRPLCRDW